MAENAFYFDGSLCIACRGCQVACKRYNALPAEKTELFAAGGGYQNPAALSASTWTLVSFHEVQCEDHGLSWRFRRAHCMHCTDASCVEVCPVQPDKAMVRTDHGTVRVDEEHCIGCDACSTACPFAAVHVDEGSEKARKCTGCYDRVADGTMPACVSTCATQALRYGSREELVARATERAAQLRKTSFEQVALYGLEQLGGLHSIYVLPGKLDHYGLAADPGEASLDAVKREARRAWAARRAGGDIQRATAGGPGMAAVAVGGLVAVGLIKLAARKAAIARGE